MGTHDSHRLITGIHVVIVYVHGITTVIPQYNCMQFMFLVCTRLIKLYPLNKSHLRNGCTQMSNTGH